MNNNTGIYIPSIDAKDIYLASNYLNHELSKHGYSLKISDKEYNLKKFINTLDYSLDLIELIEIYKKRFGKSNFAFKVKKHLYSTNVINLTFKYAVKEWNQINKHTYVKLGYEYKSLKFNDGIARNELNEIVGIKVNEKINNPISDLPIYFSKTIVDIKDKQNKLNKISRYETQYKKVNEFKTIKSKSDLRHELYKNGFLCDNKKYVRMKRSSGSARVGKCLFVRKELYNGILRFSSKGIKFRHGEVVDLAAYESYISLPSSSIIDTLIIKPENILVINDFDSMFNEDVIATYDKDGELYTEEKNCQITNSIWDGQSLMDISLFGQYSKYGMVLLRNLMFKSCCFNCNVQQWFKDNNITDISQLNGYTRATKIEDVKLITTPNSIKYLKFGTLDDWLDNLYPIFGIVKHDKQTHFFDGQLVQTHYQLLNTLQLSKDEVKELLEDSLKFIQALKNNPEVVRYFIKYPDIETFEPFEKVLLAKSDVVYNLMSTNDNFMDTKYYHEFVNDLIKAFYKNLKCGHVLVSGNYSTIIGNPIEMLQQAIGKFNGVSQLGVGNIHSKRFDYNKTLLASRSPHVTIGNIWLPYNVANECIDKYLNLTNEIVCINSIGENVLQRLSGCDFDSDTIMITDNQILIDVAKRNYYIFKTPTSFVSAKKVKRYYTPEDQADLDIKTSVNKIGEIINLSQELNSLLWDKLYCGNIYEDITDLYYDICQLDVMSGIEIDKAKKEFDVDNTKELNKIRNKYKEILTLKTKNGEFKKITPHFFSHIAKQKGYYDPIKKEYCKYHTSMDYLQTIVNGFRVKHPYRNSFKSITTILNSNNYRPSRVNYEKIYELEKIINNYISKRTAIELSTTDADKHKSFIMIKQAYEDFLEAASQTHLGYSTVYKLMLMIDDDYYSYGIKNLILQVLFYTHNDSFKRAVIESKEFVKELIPCGNEIYYYGLGFNIKHSIIKNQNTSDYENE